MLADMEKIKPKKSERIIAAEEERNTYAQVVPLLRPYLLARKEELLNELVEPGPAETDGMGYSLARERAAGRIQEINRLLAREAELARSVRLMLKPTPGGSF